MTVPPPEPNRGEVWDVDFPFGRHPGLVISNNPMDRQLGHIGALPVTGTPGPEATHVALDADAGLGKYPVSYVDVTVLTAVDKYDFVTRRGLLHVQEMERVERMLRVYLGLH